jgi:hypothetical protein
MLLERDTAGHARIVQLVGPLGVVAHEVNVPGSVAAGELVFVASWLGEDAGAEEFEGSDRGSVNDHAVKVQYANPVSSFVGHGGCDDPEWINKIVLGPNGDGDFHKGDPAAAPAACLWGVAGDTCLSRESFHPKDAGTTGYAAVMSRRLSEIGYKGS